MGRAAKTRRGHGEGSIYQRDRDKKWCGTVDLGYIAGKRVRRTVTADTRAEVVRKLKELQRTVDRGVLPTRATVSNWMHYWLDNVAAHKVRPRTLTTYRDYIKNHIDPLLGSVQLSKLAADHVRGMHAAMRRDGKSEATVLQAHRILQRALRVAVADRKIESNIAQIVGAPAAAKHPHPTLTREEAHQVLHWAAEQEDARLVVRLMCALLLGLRQGEALGLLWADVHLDEGVLWVREAVQQQRGKGRVRADVKTDSSRRRVPIPPLVVLAFREWHRQSGGVGYVFPGVSGPDGPEGPRRDWQVWKDALAAAGVRHVPLHGARGTAASLLQAAGVPERQIADILGHVTARVTQDHYIHSDETQRLDALTRLSDRVLTP